MNSQVEKKNEYSTESTALQHFLCFKQQPLLLDPTYIVSTVSLEGCRIHPGAPMEGSGVSGF